MKIIFLCGSLEPGKDGVGDYTRRLSSELILQGHQCGILAIMDRDVQEIIQETQDTDHVSVPVLRLPYSYGYKANSIEAKSWIDAFDPEWISLQYVPFSFHPKGLPFGFSNSIKQLVKGRKLHLMFHELWVRMDKEAPFKFMIWGILQKAMIRSFINKVRPLSIHSQTKLYQFQLKRIGVRASLLPLFSNIKVAGLIPKEKIPNHLRFVLFGNIHQGAPIEKFASSVSKYAFENNKIVEIVFIGRSGTELQKWITICREEKLTINVLGEQSDLKISEVLSNADLGISTTPLLLAEKSGTIAAMLEHGLPVLCVCKPWEVKNFHIDHPLSGLKLFVGNDFDYSNITKNEDMKINTITNISNLFIDSILNFK